MHKPGLAVARIFTPIQRVMIVFNGGARVTKAVSYLAYGSLLKGLPIELLMVGAETREQLDHAGSMLRSTGYATKAGILLGEAGARPRSARLSPW